MYLMLGSLPEPRAQVAIAVTLKLGWGILPEALSCAQGSSKGLSSQNRLFQHPHLSRWGEGQLPRRRRGALAVWPLGRSDPAQFSLMWFNQVKTAYNCAG
jgi:hypothetical protein